MRVLLVSANTERVNMATMPVGLGYVAAAARAAGHDVRFLDLMAESDPARAIRGAVGEHRPEVIGISVRNVDDQCRANPRFLLDEARATVGVCREASSAPIVLGGAGYSIFPEEALAYLGADFGVRGDGERVFVTLLGRLQRQEDPVGLPGVYSAGRIDAAEPLWEPMDAAHALGEDWRRSVDVSSSDLWVPVQSRRGCPNDCSYCSTCRIQGRAIRIRPPQAVIDEVVRLADAGFRQFYFVDNAFNMPESHGLALCQLLEERRLGVRWRCILYPHKVRGEFVAAMAHAGCVEVAVGFESGCERVLRAMNKHFTPGEVRQLNGLLERHGIRRTGFLLLGGPGETRESVEESLAFAASLHLDALRITTGVRIYPGTPLTRIAAEQGMIQSESGLLLPRFYLAPGLESWIDERVSPGFFTYR
ncbi:MAG: radical SAM protein [Acidobacteriota bacterium]